MPNMQYIMVIKKEAMALLAPVAIGVFRVQPILPYIPFIQFSSLDSDLRYKDIIGGCPISSSLGVRYSIPPVRYPFQNIKFEDP